MYGLDDGRSRRLARFAASARTSSLSGTMTAKEQLLERIATLSEDEARDALRLFDQRPALASKREFDLAVGFSRVDGDDRPISQIPERDLLEGFGS